MDQNKFIVDFSGLKLSDTQRTSISNAIQKAAMNELATIDTGGSQYGLLRGKLGPVNWPPHGPKGPILWGIIVRPQMKQAFINPANLFTEE